MVDAAVQRISRCDSMEEQSRIAELVQKAMLGHYPQDPADQAVLAAYLSAQSHGVSVASADTEEPLQAADKKTDKGETRQEAAIQWFSKRYPIDESVKEKLRSMPVLLRKRIMNDFRPGKDPSGDYSRRLLGFMNGMPEVRGLLKAASSNPSKGSGGRPPQSRADSSSAAHPSFDFGAAAASVLAEPLPHVNPLDFVRREVPSVASTAHPQLELFKRGYPMDDSVFGHLKAAPYEVQEKVIRTFTSPCQLSDYSTLIAMHVRFCWQQVMRQGSKSGAVGQSGVSPVQTSLAQSMTAFASVPPVDEDTSGLVGIGDTPFMRRLMGGAGAQSSRPALDNLFALKRKQEAAFGVREPAPGGAFDSLEDFRFAYPMDDRAFDFLKKLPKETSAKVMAEFRPAARSTFEDPVRDFSKQITSFVKVCTGDHRGSGAIPPVAKRTMGGYTFH